MNESPVQARIRYLVRLLVDEPERVVVDAAPCRGGLLLNVQVAPDDLGKVIGRQGRTVRALRSLLAVRGERDGQRYELEIADG